MYLRMWDPAKTRERQVMGWEVRIGLAGAFGMCWNAETLDAFGQAVNFFGIFSPNVWTLTFKDDGWMRWDRCLKKPAIIWFWVLPFLVDWTMPGFFSVYAHPSRSCTWYTLRAYVFSTEALLLQRKSHVMLISDSDSSCKDSATKQGTWAFRYLMST